MRLAVLLLLCSVLVGACSDSGSPTRMYDNYLSRLGNVLELPVPAATPLSPLAPYPAVRDLALNSEDIRVGLMDFFSFSECQMLHQISERNSGLGRVQQATVRLRYEMTFYDSLRTCLTTLREQPSESRDEAVEDWLPVAQDILDRKAEVLPIAYWNATFASPELRILLSTGTSPLQRDEPPPLTELNQDLNFLVRLGALLFEGGPGLSESDFEAHYFRLQQQKTVGQWLQSLQLSRQHLERARLMLEQARDKSRLCLGGKPTIRATYLQNVFMKFYAGEVQPYLSMLHGASQVIHPQLKALVEAQQVALPAAFKAHYQRYLDADAKDGLWQAFNRSLEAHTQAWQKLLSDCKMMPGQSNSNVRPGSS